MQKRTNPLALKGDPKSENAARGVLPIERGETTTRSGMGERSSSSTSSSSNGMRVKKASDFAPPRVVPSSEASKAAHPAFVPTFTRSSMDQPIMKPYAKTSTSASQPAPDPQPVSKPKRETASRAIASARAIPAPVVVEPDIEAIEEIKADLYEETPMMAEPYGEEEISLYDQEQYAEEELQVAPNEGCIEGEEDEFPTLQDYEQAARFSLRGQVSRKLALTRISRDVCRLAQLMHPEQSLSTIIENALMTRIFIENPEAFDAMASVIEEKGGRIKC